MKRCQPWVVLFFSNIAHKVCRTTTRDRGLLAELLCQDVFCHMIIYFCVSSKVKINWGQKFGDTATHRTAWSAAATTADFMLVCRCSLCALFVAHCLCPGTFKLLLSIFSCFTKTQNIQTLFALVHFRKKGDREKKKHNQIFVLHRVSSPICGEVFQILRGESVCRLRWEDWYYTVGENHGSLTGTGAWFTLTDVLYRTLTKLKKKKKSFPSFPLLYSHLPMQKKSCCSERNLLMNKALIQSELLTARQTWGTNSFAAASMMCVDQSLRFPKCLSTLKESRASCCHRKFCISSDEWLLRSPEPPLLL